MKLRLKGKDNNFTIQRRRFGVWIPVKGGYSDMSHAWMILNRFKWNKAYKSTL